MSIASLSRFRQGIPLGTGLLSATLLFSANGCKKTVDDATLNANVHNVLSNDPSITKQAGTIQSTTQAGVVTLTGNVSDDTASSVAAQDAAKVHGIKEVVNNLQIAGLQVAPTVTSPEAPTEARPTTVEERKVIARHEALPPPAAKPSPAQTASNTRSESPAPPPGPVYRNVTVPSGTAIPVRITETLDSKESQTGQPFNGVVTHEVVADGLVVIPAGSAVSGHVTDAKDAGHFKGNSVLSLELTSVRRRGVLTTISTEPYTVEGKGRGKNSAVKIGGGAAAGALLGGLFGGGKGAAIGSLAGGGGGAAYQGLTRGQEVSIPSETVVRFRLTSSFSVKTSEAPSERGSESPAASDAGLQPRQ